MGIWHILLLIAAYVAALSSVYAAIRIGRESGWGEGLRQLAIFLGFVVLYYLLESWAHHRLPYAFYPPVFPDMVPTFPWPAVPGFSAAPPSSCVVQPPPDAGISLSVPLLGAALTFSIMWTAQLLRAPVLLQPFLAGLVHLGIDAFFDPVLAWSFDCMSGDRIETGLGFWHWFVNEDQGPEWFGVPLFNFTTWFAAPVILVALARLLDWVRAHRARRAEEKSGPETRPSPLEGLFLTIVLAAFLLLFLVAPSYPLPSERQGLFLLALVLISLGAVVWFVPTYFHDNPLRWEFVLPQVMCLIFPLLAVILAGVVPAIPYLWVVALVTVPLVLWFSISPYTGQGS
ncbi:MAG: carotenoid biosynthesis protein [Myxococcota bacterium]